MRKISQVRRAFCTHFCIPGLVRSLYGSFIIIYSRMLCISCVLNGLNAFAAGLDQRLSPEMPFHCWSSTAGKQSNGCLRLAVKRDSGTIKDFKIYTRTH